MTIGTHLVHNLPDYQLVSDADEEVFLLYTNILLAPSEDAHTDEFHGLGHVDSRKDTLFIKLELKSSALHSDPSVKKSRGKRVDSSKTLEVELAQDKTSLRSRKGDTGSVLWKASVDLAQVLLQQRHSNVKDALLDRDALSSAHVVELGAGTGLLSIVLSPLVRRYRVTDINDILPLIRKNLALNFDGWPNVKAGTPGSNVTVEELDWVELHQAPLAMRRRHFPGANGPVDLILAVDCIYNPSLLSALVDTIDFLATPGTTAALVVMELRQEDVVREFIHLWVSMGGWEIRRVDEFLGPRYAVWVGWKQSDGT